MTPMRHGYQQERFTVAFGVLRSTNWVICVVKTNFAGEVRATTLHPPSNSFATTFGSFVGSLQT